MVSMRRGCGLRVVCSVGSSGNPSWADWKCPRRGEWEAIAVPISRDPSSRGESVAERAGGDSPVEGSAAAFAG